MVGRSVCHNIQGYTDCSRRLIRGFSTKNLSVPVQSTIVSGARSEKEDAVVERGKKGIGIR